MKKPKAKTAAPAQRPRKEIEAEFSQVCCEIGLKDYTRAMKVEEVRQLDAEINALHKKAYELNQEAAASKKEATP